MNQLSNLKTILVTGASGFLGKELVKQLVNEEGIEVIAATSKTEDYLSKIGNRKRLKVVGIKSWENELSTRTEIDVLVNCAFPRTSDPKALAEGISFTKKLISDSIALHIDSIINISSQSVYSQKEKVIVDEQSSVIPETLYGMAKFACERIVAALCGQSNVTYSNIRLGSLIGFDLEARMTNQFVQSALGGKPIVINGGKQKISYLDVRDAASALVAMIRTNPRRWNKVYNLGNREYFTVIELAETVKTKAANFTNKEVNLEIKEGESNFNNLVNSDLFYKDFKWQPNIDMPLMVNDLFEYYTKQL